MAKMSDSDLRAMLASQHQDALAATSASKLSLQRSDALAYCMGDMSKDMPSAVGRSSAVSMDVSDTIEGMMPQLMEVFTGSDEVVRFDPVGPEDVEAAKQETDYVNHVFMNQNPGFLVLYSFIKDALLEKVGVVKVWWETREEEQRETYLDKTEDEYALIVANPDIEIVEHSEHPADDQLQPGLTPSATPLAQPGMGMPPQPMPGQIQPAMMPPQMLHDVTVVMKKTYAQAKVLGVPPEEFGIERGARNIRDCNYCFHKVTDKTVADLITQGYDEKQVRNLPTFRGWTNTEEINRDSVDEHSNAGSDEVNDSARIVEIIEHYVRMDYKGNGKPCLYRVTTGGGGGEAQILKLDGKPDIEEFDAIPFAAMTPIIISHRFFGRSLADLVMDVQRIKTALYRGMLDNMYMVNNPRVEVSESHASDNTLDDLLVSRPNGIVRSKMPGGINWQVVPSIGTSVYPALEYMDSVRESRTGVSKQGVGIGADALQHQNMPAVSEAVTTSQAKVRLIARIFAETGIKDLFWLLHGTIKKHGDKPQTVRLRKQWVPVDPRQWKSREDLTVEVGLGTGSKQEQVSRIMAIMNVQKELLLGGKTNLVTDKDLFNSAKDLTKLMGKQDVESYFSDPSEVDPQTGQLKNPPPPPKPDPKVMALQMKAQLDEKSDQRKAMLDQQSLQAKSQIETVQAQADITTQQQKTQAEMAQAERKAQLEERMMMLDYELKKQMMTEELQMKRELHQHALAQNQMGMAAAAQTHEQKMAQSAQPAE